MPLAATPRGIESPTDIAWNRFPPTAVELVSFPVIWEHAVLPFLVEFIPKWCGPGHVLSVTRGKTPNTKRICIMTKRKISRARRVIIVAHVRDLLTEPYRQTCTFAFTTGHVNRLVWARGLSKASPDEVCIPRNPYYFKNPCMGDSIGLGGCDAFEESTSTLGPSLVIGGANYWLANFHPFIEAYNSIETVDVEHPSPADRSRCLEEKHDALCEERNFGVGYLAAASGVNLKTTRISHDPYWEDCDMENPLVVTDWTLITSRTNQANILRRFPSETHHLIDVPIVTTGRIVPGTAVCSSGRTSGYQRGQICEIPAYVSGDQDGNGTGTATREWFVEEPYPYDDEESWIRGGIGVEGDSGAAIVDPGTNSIIGQLWGRNAYYGPGPRQTFFTPISDVFDDIQEKCVQPSRPQLPQERDEADRYVVYPTCRQCYDLRTYMDSRRNSRESLQSMIGRNDSDQDLSSVAGISELATPQDHSYWLRHTGVEEPSSSFNSAVSPTPMAAFACGILPGTPKIVDMKSPYALAISTEDLYDTEYASRELGTNKRAADPLTRISQESKRPRF
jgi:hypothetical protein